MKGKVLLGVALAIGLVAAGVAWAQEPGQPMCIPSAGSSAIKTPNSQGSCTNTKTITYKLLNLGKEGPEGKPGKEGPEGKQGPAGPEGPAGSGHKVKDIRMTIGGLGPSGGATEVDLPLSDQEWTQGAYEADQMLIVWKFAGISPSCGAGVEVQLTIHRSGGEARTFVYHGLEGDADQALMTVNGGSQETVSITGKVANRCEGSANVYVREAIVGTN
jgi:uncharacterized low-complexity protein